jgi:hypothetical protein
MTPFGAYRCYLAMKSHFTTDSYDIVKYRGRVSAKLEAFEKRKDKYRFEKLARTTPDKEIVEMFVANFSSKPDYSGLFDDQSETRYKKWTAYQQALSYNFGNEVKVLLEDAKSSGLCYNDVFFSSEHQHPPVLLAYLGKTISVDTFVILDRLNSFVDKMVDDVVTRGILRTARKYDPFLNVDLEAYGNINKRVRESVFS